jgi:aspartyl protease family protein
MDGDQATGVVWAIGALALVGSSLLARRLPVATIVPMALLWAGLFLAAFLIAQFFT